MLKILVTGGCGFIGSHFVNTFCHYDEIFIIDNFSTGKMENIHYPSKVKIFRGDITDDGFVQKIFQHHQFDAVVHLAAVSSVMKCQTQAMECLEINYTASIKLVERSIQHKVDKFIFASSAAIYGDRPDLPKSETFSSPSPISFYGIHKYAVEKSLMIYAQKGDIAGTAFRFFNVYGPQQNPDSPYSGVISIFLDKIFHSPSPEVTIFGNGNQTRDFVHVSDIVKGLRMAILRPEMNGKVFNLGTGKETSLLEILAHLENISGKTVGKNFKEKREGDILRSYCDISKIVGQGYRSEVDLFHGLKDLYFYLQNKEKKIGTQAPACAS